MIPLDEKTINELFKLGILKDQDIRRINIIQGLHAGQNPGMLALRYKISKVAVYRIRELLQAK